MAEARGRRRLRAAAPVATLLPLLLVAWACCSSWRTAFVSQPGGSQARLGRRQSLPGLRASDESAAKEAPAAEAEAEAEAEKAPGSSDTASIAGGMVTALAGIGALDCLYLTLVKLGQTPLMCTADSAATCGKVLASPYASVGPVPLPVFGLLAYATVAALGIKPDWPQKPLIWWVCFAMATFSAGLMGVLVLVLQTPCPYCAVSAFASAALLTIVEVAQMREAKASPRRSVVALAAVVAGGAFRAATMPAMASPGKEGEERFSDLVERYKPEHPPVKNSSGEAQIALAKHLAAYPGGAACYTAWWCPHCQEQREGFGTEAAAIAPFVECSSKSRRALPVCIMKDVNGYPTWIIDGKQYRGGQDLSKLASLTGFTAYPASAFKEPEDSTLTYIWGKPDDEE